MGIREKVLLAVIGGFFGLASSNIARAGQIHICAQNNDPDDWKGMWHWGDVHIPAGTIFDEKDPPSESIPGPEYSSGIITTSGATLSRSRPCQSVTGEAVISSEWHWNVSPVFGDNSTSYYIYGMMQDGDLQTSFGSLSSAPSDGLQAAIELYNSDFTATVLGTLDQTFTFDNGDQ